MKTLVLTAALGALLHPTLHAQEFGAYALKTGDEILISEPVKPNDPATVYIYRRTGGGWTQSGTLMAPPHSGGDYFGRFLAGDGQSLLVGGTLADSSTGAVWMYERNGDTWDYVDMIRPDDVATGDSFGRFGLLHDNLLFVSGLGHNGSRGAVWVFVRDGEGRWRREAKLEPGAETPESEFFGWSLAFDGERCSPAPSRPAQHYNSAGPLTSFGAPARGSGRGRPD